MRLRWPAALDLRRSPRNADFGELQETFLVAAIATILVIRTQLWLTNYPQLGGGGLHIAHLLYGGIFMVLAIGLLVTFLGRAPRFPAALVGGVGFGFFIDELGKFITSNNNYFFEPAAALIYLIFIGLFLLTRSLQSRCGLSRAERLSNAIDLIGEAARHDFDTGEKRRALEFLDGADPAHPLVGPLRRLIAEIDAIPAPPPSRLSRLGRAVRERYWRLLDRPWFRPAIAWIFALWALLSAAAVVELVFSVGIKLGVARSGFGSDSLAHLRRCWSRSSSRGCSRSWSRSSARSSGVALDLLLLVTVRYAAQRERRREREGAALPAAAPVQSLQIPSRG